MPTAPRSAEVSGSSRAPAGGHADRFSRQFVMNLARVRTVLDATALPRIRLHDLCHTHATSLLAGGVPVKVVSERLGHANSRALADPHRAERQSSDLQRYSAKWYPRGDTLHTHTPALVLSTAVTGATVGIPEPTGPHCHPRAPPQVRSVALVPRSPQDRSVRSRGHTPSTNVTGQYLLGSRIRDERSSADHHLVLPVQSEAIGADDGTTSKVDGDPRP